MFVMGWEGSRRETAVKPVKALDVYTLGWLLMVLMYRQTKTLWVLCE